MSARPESAPTPRALLAPRLGFGLAAVVTASLVAASAPAPASAATPSDPLLGTANFTVVVAGDAALQVGASGGEIEGSLAAGGDVSFGTYNLLANKDHSALPTVGGQATQLLVGDTLLMPANANKLDLNAGNGLIEDVEGMSVSADGRLFRPDANGYLLKQTNPRNTSVADYSAHAGTFDEVFGADYFDELTSRSTELATLTPGEAAAEAVVVNQGDKLLVTLVPGVTNVWNLPSGGLVGINEVNFADATPSESTPLVINVAPGAGRDFSSARFNGDAVGGRYFAPFVVWNFAGWTDLKLVGATEMGGLVLAPQAAVEYARQNPLRGQILARSFDITGAGEIHHFGFTATVSRDGGEGPRDPAPGDEPTTEEPTTDEPTTDEPTTDEPTTDEPTTEDPKTDEPRTEEPRTDEPRAAEPQTPAPAVSTVRQQPAPVVSTVKQHSEVARLAQTGAEIGYGALAALLLLAAGASVLLVRARRATAD